MRKWITFGRLWRGIFAAMLLSVATQAQEKSVSVTIYNQNLALVREIRPLEFKKGKNEYKFTEVAAYIDPTSVHFKAVNAPEDVAILEQNYQYDLVSSEKLLQKYIDKSIELQTKQGEVYSGQLLSFDGSGLTLKQKDGGIKIVSRAEVRDISFPSLPEGLMTRPTLVWLLDSDISGREPAEVSYLTTGINWHAEYVAVADQKDQNLELAGWVSIENNSGATYPEAKLKLIAGDVHRVQEEMRLMAMDGMVTAEKAAPSFEEKAFFEYHLYTLTRPATIKDKEIKQISLFPNTTVKVQKKFIYDGAYYGSKVRVNLEFENSQRAGLGMPLPKGKIRVYKEDTDKSLEFIGEDRIDHTPKDEKVRVYVGNAFDIVGERKQTNYERVSSRVDRYSYEISVRNHKEESAQVIVVEHLSYGDWEITKTDTEFVKKDAYTIEFTLNLEKDQEKKINYTVTYRR
jgi:hypothetical protein